MTILATLEYLHTFQGDFIGREALMYQKEHGVKQLLGTFTVDIPADKDILPWGKEVIYRNDVYGGYITSAGFGFSIGKPICMGYVCSNDCKSVSNNYLRDGKYEIEIDGCKWPAELTMNSFYDPKSIKMKF